MAWPFRRRNQQRVDFQRPDDWHSLDGAPEPARTPAPAPPPAPEPEPPLTPETEPPVTPELSAPAAGKVFSDSDRSLMKVGLYVLIAFSVIAAGIVVLGLLIGPDEGGSGSSSVSSAERRTPPRPKEAAGQRWSLDNYELRRDTDDRIHFETSPDGYFGSGVIIDADDVWAVLTNLSEDGGGHWLHGIDPDTGEELWHRELEGAYCAHGLLQGHPICAEATAWEQGLGTQWTLHLIDPATGRSAGGTAEFEGWLTAISVEGDTLVVVEQRQPAPHAVVTGFDATLRQVWQLDLSGHEGHENLFSTNRIQERDEEAPTGLALDRLRYAGWPTGSRRSGPAAAPRSSTPAPGPCWASPPAAASSTMGGNCSATPRAPPRRMTTNSTACS